MTKYLAGVLTVIAAGVLLVAYGLLSPQASAFGYPNQSPYLYGSPSGVSQPAVEWDGAPTVQRVRTVQAAPAPARQTVRVVDRTPQRDWKRTAMIVGGTSATGAGLGAIFGGKKGALIGAAIGGGASTIYETTKDRN